ncbi:hypothetical protein ACVI1L_006193 [Bradyrhizobium sp. USDA 4516]
MIVPADWGKSTAPGPWHVERKARSRGLRLVGKSARHLAGKGI